MKEIKFDKKEKNGELIIDVELPARRLDRDPVTEFSNSDLISYLAEAGINLQNYELSSQTSPHLSSYSNKREDPILNGTWVFKKKVAQKVNKKTTKTYNKKVESTPTGD